MCDNQGTRSAGLEYAIFDEMALLFGMLERSTTGQFSIDKSRLLTWYDCLTCSLEMTCCYVSAGTVDNNTARRLARVVSPSSRTQGGTYWG